MGGRDSRDGVGDAGSGGDDDRWNLARRTSVSDGGEGSVAFVARLEKLRAWIQTHCFEKRADRPARNAEEGIDAASHQSIDEAPGRSVLRERRCFFRAKALDLRVCVPSVDARALFWRRG
jgi:hypothetical protein